MITCTILSGGNREHLIADCVRSCWDCVDHYTLIDTGESAQKAIGVALHEIAGRKPWSVATLPPPFDCAKARNFGLDCAAELGADWGLILDTDERLHCDPHEFRVILEQTQADLVIMSDSLRTYTKQKIFRLPKRGYWDGPVHEGFVYTGQGEVTIMSNARFSEIPKPANESTSLHKFVLAQCEQAIRDYPNNPRWHYYLGDCLSQDNDHERALKEFLIASKLSEWREESVWARYRAGVELSFLQRFDEAIALHGESVEIPEQAVHAAICASALQKYDLAIQLAERAMRMGEAQRSIPRLGFAQPETWYEAPAQLLRIVYLETGNPQKAIEADRLASELRNQRLAA